jgi:hypothetical protein
METIDLITFHLNLELCYEEYFFFVKLANFLHLIKTLTISLYTRIVRA